MDQAGCTGDGGRLTGVTVRLLTVTFKEAHNDRKEANIAPSLRKDKEEDLGEVMQQILLETISKHKDQGGDL